MRINKNNLALNTVDKVRRNNDKNLTRNMERLSSGLRINRAADDAAGLSVSDVKSQIRGLERATQNAQDGISLIQTAEGTLSEIQAILQRQRELAVQGANGIYNPEDLKAIENELRDLSVEITRIVEQTDFNGIGLLNGNPMEIMFQVGANSGQEIKLTIENMKHAVVTIPDTEKQEDFSKLIDAFDDAMELVATQRSSLGAANSRLEHTINNLNIYAENLTSAESRIRGVDMAKEMAEMTRNSVLQQASQAMLAQANQQPQSVLQLLR